MVETLDLTQFMEMLAQDYEDTNKHDKANLIRKMLSTKEEIEAFALKHQVATSDIVIPFTMTEGGIKLDKCIVLLLILAGLQAELSRV